MRAVGLLLGGLVLALAPAGTLLPQAAASPAGLDVSHTRAFTQAAMETQVLALTNKQRRRHGCRPLAMSSPLAPDWMASRISCMAGDASGRRSDDSNAAGHRLSAALHRE